MVIMKDKNDIVGKRYGKLVVQEYAGMMAIPGEKDARTHYRCKCDCGKEAVVSRKFLISGRRTSCGDCTRIVRGEAYCRYICENGQSFIFDTEDLEIVSSRRWHINNNGYPVNSDNGTNIMLSRFILGMEDGFVDHINGVRSDARKENLREATVSQNNHNMCLSSRNSSGYKGVSYYEPRGKYRAYIKNKGKRQHLGYFDTPEEAARAYDEAARFYFGEFACVNFPLPGEQCCRRNQPEAV